MVGADSPPPNVTNVTFLSLPLLASFQTKPTLFLNIKVSEG